MFRSSSYINKHLLPNTYFQAPNIFDAIHQLLWKHMQRLLDSEFQLQRIIPVFFFVYLGVEPHQSTQWEQCAGNVQVDPWSGRPSLPNSRYSLSTCWIYS